MFTLLFIKLLYYCDKFTLNIEFCFIILSTLCFINTITDIRYRSFYRNICIEQCTLIENVIAQPNNYRTLQIYNANFYLCRKNSKVKITRLICMHGTRRPSQNSSIKRIYEPPLHVAHRMTKSVLQRDIYENIERDGY